MFRNYIFDLDGTILDTLDDLANAVNHALKEMNFPQRTVDEVRGFIGNGMKKLIERSVPEGTDKETQEKMLSLFFEYYLSHIADCTRPYDGITDVLDELKRNGCRLAVVSNKADEASNAVVKAFFGDRFDIILGKRDCFPAKPMPDSVLYVMETLNMSRNDTVYAGDSDIDVQTAHNAGLPCIGVTWGNRSREELVQSGAEYIADCPADILTAGFPPLP